MDKPVHDRLFKHTFGNPEHARGELRALLPAEINEHIDWSTLQLEPTEKVDEVLDEGACDLLYSVQVDGESALLFLLFEHQSNEQPLMAFRLLRYEVRIWGEWLEHHPNAAKLPPIVPLVLYNGPKAWQGSLEFGDLLDIAQGTRSLLQQYLPTFRFLLDDLANATEAEIRSREHLTAVARLTQAALKLARSTTAADFIERWLDLLQVQGVLDLVAVGYYISDVAGAEQREEVFRLMQEHLGEAGKKAVVTIADSLRAEGWVEEAARAVLDNLDARNIDVPAEIRQRILACTDITALQTWRRRAITAEKAADIFDT